MKKTTALTLAALLLGSANVASADTLRESYVAVLSERDHFNSSGSRLTTAAGIIRQDRANFHKFDRRDDGDEGDRFFASAGNRDTLEKMLGRGTSSRRALDAIVNGTPTITVKIYRTDSGADYVNVSIVE